MNPSRSLLTENFLTVNVLFYGHAEKKQFDMNINNLQFPVMGVIYALNLVLARPAVFVR